MAYAVTSSSGGAGAIRLRARKRELLHMHHRCRGPEQSVRVGIEIKRCARRELQRSKMSPIGHSGVSSRVSLRDDDEAGAVAAAGSWAMSSLADHSNRAMLDYDWQSRSPNAAGSLSIGVRKVVQSKEGNGSQWVSAFSNASQASC